LLKKGSGELMGEEVSKSEDPAALTKASCQLAWKHYNEFWTYNQTNGILPRELMQIVLDYVTLSLFSFPSCIPWYGHRFQIKQSQIRDLSSSLHGKLVALNLSEDWTWVERHFGIEWYSELSSYLPHFVSLVKRVGEDVLYLHEIE
jgi:hypothetical protein